MVSFKKNIEYFLYFLLVMVWYFNQWSSWNGQYLDTDNYFHAYRMVQWFNNPSFWEQPIMMSNYPFGEISHWTRIFYVVWAIFTLPFLAFYSVKDAVFYGGLFICPLFFVLSIYFLIKTFRFVFSWKIRLLLVLMLGVQTNFVRTAIFYRPDHHVVFVFFSIFMIYLLKNFIDDKKPERLKSIGLVLAVLLWLQVEGLFFYVTTLAFLYVAYLYFGWKYDYLLKVCWWYGVGVSFCWLINPCYQGYLFIDTGRISLFYVVFAFGVYGICRLGLYFENMLKRSIFLLVLGGIGIGILWWVGWLKSPIDERIAVIFMDRITEMKGINLYTGAYPLFGICLGGLNFNKHKKDEQYVYLFLCLLVYGGLTLFGERFLPYSGMYGAIMIAWFMEDRLKSNKKILLLSVFFVLMEYISFVLNLVLFGNVWQKKAPDIYFDNMDKLPQGSVVTDTFFTPHFLWYGNRPIVASPYHRNVEGILDNHKILFSNNEKEVIELIKKHKVGFVYLVDTEDGFYANPKENCDKLYGKILGCKNYPHWLIPLDGGVLFKVDYDKL